MVAIIHLYYWEMFLVQLKNILKFVNGIKEEKVFRCKFWHTFWKSGFTDLKSGGIRTVMVLSVATHVCQELRTAATKPKKTIEPHSGNKEPSVGSATVRGT